MSDNQAVEGEELKNRVRPVIQRWERGELLAWDESFAPDLLVTGFTADGLWRARGPEEITENLRGFFQQFRDFRVKAANLEQLDEETVLMEGRQFGTGRLSGLEIDETLYVVFRFRSGQLAEMHWHVDRDRALAAAGLSDER